MPLQAPNLDNRRYADIVAEAKTLIPRYAPEWTDHNDSDPGIALLQLFAWMTDMLMYRLNQVPERHYVKFLELLGVELHPARPATAELTFTLTKDATTAGQTAVSIPKGTKVAAPGDDDGPIQFETDETLYALEAALAAVQVYDGYSYSLKTNANADNEQTYHPFGVYAREESALLLGFSSTLPFTTEQVALALSVAEAAPTTGRDCTIDLATLPAAATLSWEYWDGTTWALLNPDKDETQALVTSGFLYFRGPGSKIQKAVVGAEPASLYWIRCRLVKSFYETPPKLAQVRTNTVRATQALSIENEVLGGSSGRPDQTVQLLNFPVVALPRPETVRAPSGQAITSSYLVLEIDGGSGFELWQQVDDFLASGGDDAHYVLNRTTGEIRFGNGVNGRIPVANPANPTANIVARRYRFGGGKRGNVGPNALADLQDAVPYVDKVTNQRAAGGGSDEESVDEAKARAPREVKSRSRAVTSEDFEHYAQETPGVRVRRAKALPLAHPKFPGVTIPGAVTVIVIPDTDDPRPTPGRRTLEAVCRCLNAHRLLTTEVFVVPPTYRQVRIIADVIATPESDLGEVKQLVAGSVSTFFHPLTGGKAGLGWPFGGTIFFSEVYRVILDTPGVARIDNNSLLIELDGEAQPNCQDVTIDPGELLTSGAHEIRVTYGQRQ